MLPVSGELEALIRQHERLLMSLGQARARLDQKGMVASMLSRHHEMEINGLRVKVERLVGEVAEVEARIDELKAAQDGG